MSDSITIPNPVPHSSHRIPLANLSPQIHLSQFAIQKIKIGKKLLVINVENEVSNIIHVQWVSLHLLKASTTMDKYFCHNDILTVYT